MPLSRLLAATLAAAAFVCLPSWAQPAFPLNVKLPPHAKGPDRPAASAPAETVGGELEALVVHDMRHGATLRYFSLREAGGARIPVKWLDAEASVAGATVQLEGRRAGATFFVDRAATLSKPAAAVGDVLPANVKRYRGRLEILHADHPESDRCELHYVLNDGDMHLRLDMASLPDILEPGMSLAVDGVATDDGLAVVPNAITIDEGNATATAGDTLAPAAVTGTTKVLVILIKYLDTATEPYTRDKVLETVFTGTTSVADYFREASYGKHTLSGTVTPWLRASFVRPTSCVYSKVSTEAMAKARAAGYNTDSYQKFVFVFPSLPGCGWAGLGGGSYAWINQNASTLVIGHELGHTFGLGHASSLTCKDGTVPTPLDGTCTRSEYGDTYSMMGNYASRHFSAPHKVELGYISATGHKVHGGGTATYTLSRYEVAGGTTYALKIPASATRTYWLEFRQPIGFDATLPGGITSGALVHTAYPSSFSCDSCLLDMTPSTTSKSDAALDVGQTYNDTDAQASISVLSATATSLSVRVTTPVRPTYTDVASTHSAYSAIETLAWHGIALECATGRYCPDRAITRSEMAAFLERAKRGPQYAFAAATGTRFADVSAAHWAAKYIEQLYTDGITTGCASSPLRFCPDSSMTRAQMAPMLLKARYGSTFSPGTATGALFLDVSRTHSMAAWIERLYGYAVTLGCNANPRYYCPEATVTRAQMAIFIQRAFNLAAPPL